MIKDWLCADGWTADGRLKLDIRVQYKPSGRFDFTVNAPMKTMNIEDGSVSAAKDKSRLAVCRGTSLNRHGFLRRGWIRGLVLFWMDDFVNHLDNIANALRWKGGRTRVMVSEY